MTHYLVHEVTAKDWQSFLNELDDGVPDGTRAEQAAFIISHDEPWVVAHAFHVAALNAVPTLDEHIGQLATWPDASLQENVGVWLNAHANDEQLAELAAITNHPERNSTTPWYTPEPTGWDLAENLTPPTLLDARNYVVGPAESDLTDRDWELLVPLQPALKNQYGTRSYTSGQLASLRRALDGIRYRFARDIPWSEIPQRYGDGRNRYQRYSNYRRKALFARMLNALRGQPEAAGLVLWLEEIVDSGHREGDSADQTQEEGV